MDHTGLGTLSRQGDRWTLRFTRRLAHPREKVWRAVTAPEHLAVWYPQEIVGERKAGAPLRFVTSAATCDETPRRMTRQTGRGGPGPLPARRSQWASRLPFNAEFPAGISTYRAYRLPRSPGV